MTDTTAPLVVAVRGKSPLQAAVHRLLANQVARGGLLIILGFILMAALAPVFLPYNPATDSDLLARLKPPTGNHPFGTDALGRDILMRILHGALVSLSLGVGSVILAGLIGACLGLLAGYAGRRTDLCLMFCMDILLAFPATLLAIAIVAMIGPGLRNALIAISVVSIPFYARITRGEVLTLKEREFVTAARALGGGSVRVILSHIFPNTLPPLAVQTTLAIAFAILEAAALGFLGLGAQPPVPEWGAMLADSYKFFTSGAWWAFFFPGVTIMLSVLGFNLVGDALRDALDPRMRI
ncbi:MAG: peptide ABC transporter permease [candidate division NC10 bacterium RBG_16_65_8]|nr:MAG: peptide ABC transporter permease [candidate division NC10 bacterium RBG_16_65_8]